MSTSPLFASTKEQRAAQNKERQDMVLSSISYSFEDDEEEDDQEIDIDGAVLERPDSMDEMDEVLRNSNGNNNTRRPPGLMPSSHSYEDDEDEDGDDAPLLHHHYPQQQQHRRYDQHFSSNSSGGKGWGIFSFLGGGSNERQSMDSSPERFSSFDDEDDDAYDTTPLFQAVLLAFSLGTILMSFWILDSVKDPVFATLVQSKASDEDNSSADEDDEGGFHLFRKYQPTAKMFSVASTLALVCAMEYFSATDSANHNEDTLDQKRRRVAGRRGRKKNSPRHSGEGEGGGYGSHKASVELFYRVGAPYCVMFAIIGICLSMHPSFLPAHGGSIQRLGKQKYSRSLSYVEESMSNPVTGLSRIRALASGEEEDMFSPVFWSSWTGDEEQVEDSSPAGPASSSVMEPTPETQTSTVTGVTSETPMKVASSSMDKKTAMAWTALGYIMYATIESYGSLSVATFWSYVNSTLDLASARKRYGLIIAIAQMGAIAGSSIVAHYGRSASSSEKENGNGNGRAVVAIPRLFWLCVLVVCINMALMKVYERLYPSDSGTSWAKHQGRKDLDIGSMGTRDKFVQGDVKPMAIESSTSFGDGGSHRSAVFRRQGASSQQKKREPSFLSGMFLIFRHNYLIMILGVSCLYEVAMTCLDYEMKLVGLEHFRQMRPTPFESGSATDSDDEWGFTTFMGHYGQLTNVLSLILSFAGFPLLMKYCGLRHTLRLFPTALLVVTVMIFVVLPQFGQKSVWVTFACLATLKAMTYSINDPAKEILYIPTTDDVKLRGKFWIDVVGARVAKAVGSTVTNYAGSADRILQYGALPSVVASAVLLVVSVKAGVQFDRLVRRGEIVGGSDDNVGRGGSSDDEVPWFDDVRYQRVNVNDNEDDYYHDESNKYGVDDVGRSRSKDEDEVSNYPDDDSGGWKSETTIELVPTSNTTTL